MKYFDIHSHLNLSPLSERKDEIIKTLEEKEAGTITVGTDFETSAQAVAIAIESNNLFASVGLHPTEVMEKHFDLDEFRNLAGKNKVVAIGECGLDYFRIDASDESTKNLQKEIFNKQIDLAIEKNLPLILHIRPQKGTMDAYEDVLEILESKLCEVQPRTGNVQGRTLHKIMGDVHFFVGSPEIAERFLKLGFYLSFTGVITFARDYDEVIRLAPIDRILTETDAPFVAPIPHRGEVCEPWMVEEVMKKIAEIKGLDLDETRLQILENVKTLFGI
jgi:TatD DNase family protein